MIKVITYGTYDLLHYGHIRLLERAKALGDYLIVGITSDGYDIYRGKINNQQSLMERIIAIKETGLADEIVIEEYEGQKIDDIKKYTIDIFAIGSDWEGKFDYLSEFCRVIYLPRTEGISSSGIRSEKRNCKIHIAGSTYIEKKYKREFSFVNGIDLTPLSESNAVYLYNNPLNRYEEIAALIGDNGYHILVESPISLKREQAQKLFDLAQAKDVVLFDGIKTAYSIAFQRLLVLIKSGKIGDIISVDATCTSMTNIPDGWNSITAWGPTALLPVFAILGTKYREKEIYTHYEDKKNCNDAFTKVDFLFEHAVASIKVGHGGKSEGELIITGKKGYIMVPAPWWKTEYFEVRYENPQDNQKYFYQLDREGIRNEVIGFVRSISEHKNYSKISTGISLAIADIMEEFYAGKVKDF